LRESGGTREREHEQAGAKSRHKIDNSTRAQSPEQAAAKNGKICVARAMLNQAIMDIVRTKIPAPRLLSSVAPLPADKGPVIDSDVSGARLSRSGVFCGTSRWWFVGILLGGGLVIFSAHTFHDRYITYQQHQRELRLLQVQTQRLAAAPHSSETPLPMVIRYSPEMLQISAIALGHPRLAVINGRTLTEGDSVLLHTPTHNVAVSLRVTKIADGHVDLSDGMHTITAHLRIPSTKRP
jgi:hypothetical protein